MSDRVDPLFNSGFRDALAVHLEEQGMAESQRGYGHPVGEQVAEVVVEFIKEWMERHA